MSRGENNIAFFIDVSSVESDDDIARKVHVAQHRDDVVLIPQLQDENEEAHAFP